MPGFVSPYASAVTGNRLRPFPSAPLRTGLDTFASSGSPVALSFDWFLLILVCPRRSSGVDRDVASLADDEGLAPHGRHDLEPGRFLPLALNLQVRELSDVVDLNLFRVCHVLRRWRGASRQFAFRIPPRSSHLVTYPPLPGVRLSRTRTTMGVPSPWGSRPEGDLRFLHNLTSEHGLGPPFIPTPGLDRPVSHRAGLP